jgi:hypothetical protein
MQDRIGRAVSRVGLAVIVMVVGVPLAGVSVGLVLSRMASADPTELVAEGPSQEPAETAGPARRAEIIERGQLVGTSPRPTPRSSEPPLDYLADLEAAMVEEENVTVAEEEEPDTQSVVRSAVVPVLPPAVMAQPVAIPDPWAQVRWCESRDRYDINTGNGFYGAYQFTLRTWDWVAGLIDRSDLIGVRPDLASPADQDRLAQALGFEIRGGGLKHWPVCGAHYGT